MYEYIVHMSACVYVNTLKMVVKQGVFDINLNAT